MHPPSLSSNLTHSGTDCLQVLHQFVRGSELEEERLAYFASPEGRDDLYQYNHREGAAARQPCMVPLVRGYCSTRCLGAIATMPYSPVWPACCQRGAFTDTACCHAGRTMLEVLNDFKSARLPLEWLLQVRENAAAAALASLTSSLQPAMCVLDSTRPCEAFMGVQLPSTPL